ncbi:MAG: energy transducer TonB, partial [Lysobacteraceae bacterium]
LDTPRAVDTAAPPPAPPAPPSSVPDISGGVDASSRAMNPPKYPPEELRRGIQGTTVLIVSIDASGSVLDVEVERSSGNRNLDRAAVAAARRWKFNAEVRDGRKVASRVRVPVDFTLR